MTGLIVVIRFCKETEGTIFNFPVSLFINLKLINFEVFDNLIFDFIQFPFWYFIITFDVVIEKQFWEFIRQSK